MKKFILIGIAAMIFTTILFNPQYQLQALLAISILVAGLIGLHYYFKKLRGG